MEPKIEIIKVIGYCRVSDIKQMDSGHSIETQQEIIKKYCTTKGLTLVKCFSEQLSGGVPCDKRTEFQKAIKFLKSGKAIGMVITKFDRLSRDLKDLLVILETYFKKDFSIYFTDFDYVNLSEPEGRFQMHMFATFAQLEKSIISKRTKQVLEIKKEKNHKLGGFIPYGKKIEIVNEGGKEIKKLVDNIEELELKQELRKFRDEHHCSYKKLGQILVERGIKNRNNRIYWPQATVLSFCYPELCTKKVVKKEYTKILPKNS